MNKKFSLILVLLVLGLVSFWLLWDLDRAPSDSLVSAPAHSNPPSNSKDSDAHAPQVSVPSSAENLKAEKSLALSPLAEPSEGREDQTTKKKEKPIPYARILNLIRKEKVVNRIETETDEKGVRSTLTVYANGPTQMRTLLQEDWVDGPNGPELIGWNAMAADYILVKIDGSPSSSEFAGKINDFRAKISATPIPGVYKVHFDGTDPIILHEIKDTLKTVADVDFSEPDYIMGIE